MEVAGLILLGGVAFFGASALIGRARITVFEYERGLWFRNGRFRRVLGLRVQKIDVRETPAAVTGQEVLTADGVPIKASVVGSYAVAEADRAILGPDDYRSAVYSEFQLALRAVVTQTKIDDLLEQRSELSGRLKEIRRRETAAARYRFAGGGDSRSHVPWRAQKDLHAGRQCASGRARGSRKGSRGDSGTAEPGERRADDRAEPESDATAITAGPGAATRKHYRARASAEPHAYSRGWRECHSRSGRPGPVEEE
jgi:hypothetical protein